jgi:NAD(P)-dependent dehydrogenase (short-subunit alcohol dehydrogenase family)
MVEGRAIKAALRSWAQTAPGGRRAMTASTALITGASRGIGREIARTLASEGWHVLSAVRDPKSAPPGTQPEVVDVATAESIEALAERLRARNQLLEALVNNAGVYRGSARQIWDVNVLGPLRLTRGLEPCLARNARVVMVTSGLGQLSAQPPSLAKRLSSPRLSLAELERLAEEAPGGYGESKAALTAMARLFAEELRPRGISSMRSIPVGSAPTWEGRVRRVQ